MITVLTGVNGFMLQNELRQLVDAFIKEHGDIALERLDGEEAEYDRIREALESLPFLATRKLVVLKRPSANKQFLENFEKLLDELPESTDLIIAEPKTDKRSVYYKTLKKLNGFKEFNELDSSGMARWLVSQAKEQGGNLGMADANYLVDRIGINQLLLSKELEKLLLYSPEISRETIDLMTERTPQSTIFELLDAAFAGQTKKALDIYDEQRRMKVEPLNIIAMMAWQLHILAVIKTADKRSIDEIAAETKLSPYVLRKSQQIAGRLSYKELKELVGQVLDLDIALKSQSIDADEALSNLIMQLRR